MTDQEIKTAILRTLALNGYNVVGADLKSIEQLFRYVKNKSYSNENDLKNIILEGAKQFL